MPKSEIAHTSIKTDDKKFVAQFSPVFPLFETVKSIGVLLLCCSMFTDDFPPNMRLYKRSDLFIAPDVLGVCDWSEETFAFRLAALAMVLKSEITHE